MPLGDDLVVTRDWNLNVRIPDDPAFTPLGNVFGWIFRVPGNIDRLLLRLFQMSDPIVAHGGKLSDIGDAGWYLGRP